MKLFLIVVCLAVSASAFNGPLVEILPDRRRPDPFDRPDLFIKEEDGTLVPRFTCDRHVVMRCTNVFGDDVYENGRMKNPPSYPNDIISEVQRPPRSPW